ncbi:hypothetical protein [Fluviispira sanaruensis]|uniref:Uncharacterized protein n=1 Tax=Fluviispira sanaruensis TaxID=2493639 RepID=A0A4V0P223_FLUSA|nr:hypothetical protein [Fluviispira sanaruensis]BBH51727.1 hypothetical protein JCM31447_01440 [Fluviispira sanaruensis]
MYLIVKLALIFISTFLSKGCFALKEVKIHAIFPFLTNVSIVDNASYPPSVRQQILAGIPMALMYYQDKAEKCGYFFSYKMNSFNMFDHDSLKQSISKVNNNAPWIVYGPEMNTGYYLINSNLNSEIPHLTSLTLLKNKGNQFTLSPDVDLEIKTLFNVVKEKKINRDFMIIYDNTCDMCKIYQESVLKITNSMGFNLLGNFSYKGHSIEELNDFILSTKPDFVFLNVKSSDAGLFMSRSTSLKTLFIGTKIWGTDVNSNPALTYNLKNVNGFTVGPKPPEKYRSIRMQVIDNNLQSMRLRDNPYYMKYFIKVVTETLCKYKPKNKDEFYKIIQEKKVFKRDSFNFAIYTLKDGNLKYEKSFIVKDNNVQ